MKNLNTYHDAILLSIEHMESLKELSLSFIIQNGDRRKLKLCGCDIFRAVDFTPQNVVSRLMIFSGPEIIRKDIEGLLKWASSMSDSSSYLSNEASLSIIDKISRTEKNLLWLDPSNGAEIVAVFEGFQET